MAGSVLESAEGLVDDTAESGRSSF